MQDSLDGEERQALMEFGLGKLGLLEAQVPPDLAVLSAVRGSRPLMLESLELRGLPARQDLEGELECLGHWEMTGRLVSLELTVDLEVQVSSETQGLVASEV